MELKNKIDSDNEEVIHELLKVNSLQRNRHLNNVMRIFCDLSSPITLGIDGMWGMGKTIFARQLEFLANNKISDDSDYVDLDNKTNFQNLYDVYYFNSWEYDIYEHPLQIFLYDLIKHRKKSMCGQDKKIAHFNEIVEKSWKPIAKVFTKTASMGLLEYSDIELEKSKEEIMFESMTHIEDMKENIVKILEALTEDKKIIILLDELDRCKPTFAVELLEVIKHYFSYEKISYVLCCNKKELSYTLKKYYGEGFDGYGYLDRFIDIEYNLPAPNLKNYLSENLKFGRDGNEIVKFNCNFFDLSLRQINKYALFSELVMNRYKKRRGNGSLSDNTLIQIIFPLYIWGLKITNIEKYHSFLIGEGTDDLNDYLIDGEEFLQYLVIQNRSFNDSSTWVKMSIEQYEEIFSGPEDYKKDELLDIISFFD